MTSSKEPAPAGNPERKRNVFVALTYIVVPAIAILSFLPWGDKRRLHTEGRFHSWGHLVAFSVVAYIASRTARTLQGRILLFIASLAFGFGIEFGEHLVFGSWLEWKDVLVDGIGVVGGTLIAIISAPKKTDSR